MFGRNFLVTLLLIMVMFGLTIPQAGAEFPSYRALERYAPQQTHLPLEDYIRQTSERVYRKLAQRVLLEIDEEKKEAYPFPLLKDALKKVLKESKNNKVVQQAFQDAYDRSIPYTVLPVYPKAKKPDIPAIQKKIEKKIKETFNTSEVKEATEAMAKQAIGELIYELEAAGLYPLD